jgi:hypothetical protein
MACRFFRRRAGLKLRPWMLKQVQHDEISGQLTTRIGHSRTI